MNENLHTRFTHESDCLCEQEMFDYVDNKLPSLHMNRVEKHLLDCEMCADAVEGLSILQNRNKLGETRDLIKLKVKAGNAKEAKIISLWKEHKVKLSIAASVLLLIGVSGIVSLHIKENNSKKVIAEVNKPAAPAESLINVTSSPGIVQEEKEEVATSPAMTLVTPEVPKKVSETVVQNLSEVENSSVAGEITPTEDLAVAATASGRLEDIPMPASEAREVNSGAIAQDIAYTNKALEDKSESFTKSRKSESAVKVKSASSSMSRSAPETSSMDNEIPVKSNFERDTLVDPDFLNGKHSYRNKDYSTAIYSFKKYFEKNKQNPQALLYCAISYLNVSNTDNALTLLNEVLEGGYSSYFEQANYYKALALLKQNNKQKAKKLLEKIVKQNGEYKTRAQEELTKLD